LGVVVGVLAVTMWLSVKTAKIEDHQR
jgi:hypothetical protein